MSRTLITVNGRYKGDCSCGYMSLAIEAGRSKERKAIVAWLNTGCAADWWMAPDFAEAIENGDHLRGDDE